MKIRRALCALLHFGHQPAQINGGWQCWRCGAPTICRRCRRSHDPNGLLTCPRVVIRSGR